MKLSKALFAANVYRPARGHGSGSDDDPCVSVSVNRRLASGKLDQYSLSAPEARSFATALLVAAEFLEGKLVR